MSSLSFSTTLFNDWDHLKRYFQLSLDEASKKVQSLENSESLKKSKTENPASRTLLGRLNWLSSPILNATTGFLDHIIEKCNHFGLKNLSSLCKVVSSQIQYAHEWYFEPQGKNVPRVPAVNCPQLSAWKIYMHLDIPLKSITPKIRAFTYQERSIQNKETIAWLDVLGEISENFLKVCRKNKERKLAKKIANGYFLTKFKNEKDTQKIFTYLKKKYPWTEVQTLIENVQSKLQKQMDILNLKRKSKQFKLYKSKGICRGASQLFIHLYHCSNQHSSDPEKHLLAVAKQFVKGVLEQGILFQAFTYDFFPTILGYKVNTMDDHEISIDELEEFEESELIEELGEESEELPQGSLEVCKKIDSLPSGIYEVGGFDHSFVYIKLENGKCYTWDSNEGLFNHDSAALCRHLIDIRDDEEGIVEFRKYEPVNSEPSKGGQ